MKKVVVVVVEGCVESVFIDSEEDFELEIVDFDGDSFIEDQKDLADYVAECRRTMKEI